MYFWLPPDFGGGAPPPRPPWLRPWYNGTKPYMQALFGTTRLGWNDGACGYWAGAELSILPLLALPASVDVLCIPATLLLLQASSARVLL